MVWIASWVAFGGVLSAVSARPAREVDDVVKRQYSAPPAVVDRAQAVIDTFRLSWAGYSTYAFPNDELHPVTNTFGNSRYVYNPMSQMVTEKSHTDMRPATDGVPRPPTHSPLRWLWAKGIL